MYTNTDHRALSQAMDEIAVPMFAAERRNRNELFRFIGVNAAHTSRTGLTNDIICGAHVRDLLSHKDAEAVEQHYRDCVDREIVVNYAEMLEIEGEVVEWNTTLQPVLLRDGTQRVIGTAIALNQHVLAAKLEDAAYYATTAQMQIAQLRGFLQHVENRNDLPADLRNKALLVEGLTRSIDALLFDIRKSTSEPNKPRKQHTLTRFGSHF